MSRSSIRFGLAALAAGLLASPLLAQRGAEPPPSDTGVSRGYQSVTAERLLEPEAENWLMIRRTYDGWGFSPLAEITADNVSSLRQVWMVPTD